MKRDHNTYMSLGTYVLQAVLIIALLLGMNSCSTTSNLPEDEYLYTGIKEVNVLDRENTKSETTALEEMQGALDYAPNNSLFGSSTIRYPLPIGLWVYDHMAGKKMNGIQKWFFNIFSATPKTISTASPDTRVMVAKNILQNYGYFNANVDYELIAGRNPRTRKIKYIVQLGHAYDLDSVRFSFPTLQDSIVQATSQASHLKRDNQFSVADLQAEKTRLSTEFHNNGLYYYRPDYINYYADSINSPGKVLLLVNQDKATPDIANRQWKYGRVSAYIRKNSSQGSRMAYNDTVNFRRLTVAFQGKSIPVKPRVMFRNFKFWTGHLYNEQKVTKTISELRNMNIFSNVQFSFEPHDTTDTCSVIDVRLDATMDKLIDTELDFNFTQKSNSQIGPDLALTFARRNAFKHAETLALKLRGSYFWQLKNRSSKDYNNLDSYEFGAEVSLSYPWLVSPGFLLHRFSYPTSTKFSVSFTRTNIAKAYRFNQIAFSADYTFKTSDYITHTFTPLRLEIMDLRDIVFSDSTSSANSIAQLLMVMSDDFVPSMQYTFSYNNTSDAKRSIGTHLQFTVKEGGNIINGIGSLCGWKYNEKDKTLFGKPYNQFIKLQMELRNKFSLTPHSNIATRLLVGAIKTFGNSTYTPISELYYAGGANSIRAFAARSIGPGGMTEKNNSIYILHGGDFRFELNAEYRFPIFGNLYGALFLDAGNVWKFKGSSSLLDLMDIMDLDEETAERIQYLRDQQWLTSKNFLRQIALGTGFGLRYDLEFLVLRFDVGVALHAPYETSKKGYYNIPRFFKDGIGLNLAVGYPF